MFTFVASFSDSPTRLLSEFGHSKSPFLYVHIQSLCNVRTLYYLNSYSTNFMLYIVECPILQPFVTVFHSMRLSTKNFYTFIHAWTH